MNPSRVKRCLLCGDEAIDATIDGRIVTTCCHACRAVLSIEFDPPDEPALRARIERIDDRAPTPDEASGSDPGTRKSRRSDTRNSPIAPAASRRR
jgi:hypothetical protein